MWGWKTESIGVVKAEGDSRLRVLVSTGVVKAEWDSSLRVLVSHNSYDDCGRVE